MKTLFDPIRFERGPEMRNRFMLAPLTNMQSHPDGRMSPEEFRWLELRTRGGFGAMSTCAADVQPNCSALYGSLGIFDDMHIEPLKRIGDAMKLHGNLSLLQLKHDGLLADRRITRAEPAGPFEDPKVGGRALSTLEVEQLIEDFILAAKRVEAAGLDGVEVHGAHRTMLAQFLSPTNRRTDGYGGSFEDRTRIIFSVLDGIRARCRPDFVVGLRLSSERFDIRLDETRQLAEQVMTSGKVDFLDMSLWNVFKDPEEAQYKGKPLIFWFTDLKRGKALLGVAGKITTGATAKACIDAGADFVRIGRGAIIHYDFPNQVRANPNFESKKLPVSKNYLDEQGVSEAFINYLRRWEGFVDDSIDPMYTDEADMVDGTKLPVCIAPQVKGEFKGRSAPAERE